MKEFNLRLGATSLVFDEVDGYQVIKGIRCGFTATSLPENKYPFEMTGTISLTAEEINNASFGNLDAAVSKKLTNLFSGATKTVEIKEEK